MKQRLRKRNGFTLIEMTIVLFIISLLILIIIPNISKARQSAQSVHKKAMVSLVKTQVGNYEDSHDDEADYDKLRKGYLTSAQVNKAESYHIDIQDGKVIDTSSKN